jgi:hypothetical protein
LKVFSSSESVNRSRLPLRVMKLRTVFLSVVAPAELLFKQVIHLYFKCVMSRHSLIELHFHIGARFSVDSDQGFDIAFLFHGGSILFD